MKIAVDYDDTFTRDKRLFAEFISNAIKRGHNVTFVTFRPPGPFNRDIEKAAELLGIDIVYTGGRQKQHCFEADIWIDDKPELIPSSNLLQAMYNGCVANKDLQLDDTNER